MKKNLLFTLLLCLLALISCEQQAIFYQPTEDAIAYNANTNNRSTPCDLTIIPLYIPPAATVPSGTLDFSMAFPVTESIDYETANSTSITIQSISYSVNNGTPTTNPLFSYIQNVDYELVIGVNYSIGFTPHTEVFSLSFKVTNTQSLTWGKTNWCEYRKGNGGVGFRNIASLILP